MALALFDLDNTLLHGDSDYAWGQFLVERGIVDGDAYEKANRKFYDLYKEGRLDIYEFIRFAFLPLKENDHEQLLEWRQQFVEEKIAPMMLAKGQQTIDKHRSKGDTLIIITATNSFVTTPIAEAFGVEHLIATEPEFVDGRFTGDVAGVPCFQEGKVKRLQTWLDDHRMTLEGSTFYSDSHNDLPLLEQVSFPVAVDADDKLVATATSRNWPITSFR